MLAALRRANRDSSGAEEASPEVETRRWQESLPTVRNPSSRQVRNEVTEQLTATVT